MSRAKKLFSALIDEFQRIDIPGLKDAIKEGALHRNGVSEKTIEIASAHIAIHTEPSGVTNVTVFDRPQGYPYKPGVGITFFLEESDEVHDPARVARDVLYWMSLHATIFRQRFDLHRIVEVFKELDSPTLRHEYWRTQRKIPAYT